MSAACPTDEYMRKLMNVEEQTPNVYRANFLISPAGRGIAYGGLLFAQSLQSAQQTQEESSIEHQVAMPNVPDPESLVNTVDFCREHLEKQERGELEMSPLTSKVMANTLQGADDDLFLVRPCDPRKYYCLEESDVEPMCFWVKTKCALSDDREEHRFLVGYMTDFSLASVAVRPHCSRGYVPSMTLSLDHVVRFHDDNYRADEWLLYENWSPWAKYGRAFSEGRLWTRDGRLVLSTSQESLSRTRGEKSAL
ncbi:Acyl-coenzyme A thioesterase 8 [Aphelenchoides fujianensis]|nr:Acyl-coenzyme A thioesterase 8 [Aphelenchoides fujianensis]